MTDLSITVHDCLFSSSCSLREQLADLYQTIHSSANITLLQQYEEIIQSLISQSLDTRLECEQLETSLKRYAQPSHFSFVGPYYISECVTIELETKYGFEKAGHYLIDKI